MSADPILSQLYPTGNTAPAEPTADEIFMSKVSAALTEQGIDFDSMTPQEQDEVIQSALEQEQAPAAGAQPEAATEATKEAEAKLIEADTMGRVMAHSFNQELGELQKESASGFSKKERLMAALQKGKGKAVAGAKAVAGKARAVAAHPGARKGAIGAGLLAAGYGAGRMKKSAAEGAQEFIENTVTERTAEALESLGIEPEQLEAFLQQEEAAQE